jgi:hypothetical protein
MQASAQIAIAWLLARSPITLPIPGTSPVAHLEENVTAMRIRLSPPELAELSRSLRSCVFCNLQLKRERPHVHGAKLFNERARSRQDWMEVRIHSFELGSCQFSQMPGDAPAALPKEGRVTSPYANPSAQIVTLKMLLSRGTSFQDQQPE